MFLMASEVEQLYKEDGRAPAITTLWGLWFLLPIVGRLIERQIAGMVRAQGMGRLPYETVLHVALGQLR